MLLIERKFQEKFYICAKCKYNDKMFCQFHKKYINKELINTCKNVLTHSATDKL